MNVITVANQKGGVGKTTVTRELSACCALRGYQTLVIDCDPQANLTASWLEPDIYNITLSLGWNEGSGLTLLTFEEDRTHPGFSFS